MDKFTVTSKQKGERLDKFLVDNLSGFSRNQIQKLIKEEKVLVGNKVKTPNYSLKEGDVVDVRNILEPKTKEEFTENPLPLFSKISFRNFFLRLFKGSKEKVDQLNIIADNKEYLVLNKPAGLTVHGASYIKGITLADYIEKKYPKLKKVGDDPFRPGIVHRLDREVSGLMVIAKNNKSFENLKKQFMAREVEKEYTALVYGKTDRDYDQIDFAIKRKQSGYKMASIPSSRAEKNARQALTEFRVDKRFINFTLLKIKIKTGRTHQIRVHMSAYNHPIVGDNLYNTKRTREKNAKLNLGRIFLVATKLSFRDLAGKKREFKIDLPDDLKEFLKKIK